MPIVGLGTDLARVTRFSKFVEAQKTALLSQVFASFSTKYSCSHFFVVIETLKTAPSSQTFVIKIRDYRSLSSVSRSHPLSTELYIH